MTDEAYRRRVLLLTPTGRDAQVIGDALSRHGLATRACADALELSRETQAGAGVIVIAEEALSPLSLPILSEMLQTQAPWSDLPLVIMSTSGESTPETMLRLERLAPLGNVTVIERPVRPATLFSVVASALRARERQYESEQLVRRVQLTEERLRTMIESAKDYAFINLDLTGRITYWNSGAERLLGHAEPDILGRSIEIIFTAEDRQAGVPDQELETALKTGRAADERWQVRRDGSRFWASGVVSRTRDGSGQVTGFVKVLRDMTEHKLAEERLAEQAQALEQSNEDLQRFAYVASHDLQEPLRAISSYSELLIRKNEGRLTEDSRLFVEFIVTGVERMRMLIRDLLEFSRLAMEDERPAEPVDCNIVVSLALQQLQLKIDERRASVSVGRLPVVLAHESRLLLVFQNLIGNALKYCEAEPRVHISAERDGGHWRICIRDNGIGIAPEHQQKIFGLFQRLHSRAEYPGVGIGLATCKRIIEQEGGRLWVESARGSGSTFCFTLPPAKMKGSGDNDRANHACAFDRGS